MEPDFDEIDEAELYQEDYDTWDGEEIDDRDRDLTCRYCNGTGQDWDLTPCEHCDGEGERWWMR